MANDLKFLKGMIKDTGQMDQIDGTYRDALNLIVDDLRGNVANEYGTVNIGNLNISGIALPGGGTETVAMDPIGQVALLDDNFIIFSAGSFNATVGVILVSAIHKINVANNTSQVLYYTLDRDLTTGQVNPLGHLNFDTRHPITAELRLSPSQEQIVYFTDNKHTFIHDPATDIEYVSEYNPPRVFNVTKQEESLISSSDTTNLYGNFSRTDFLNLFMDAGRIPEFGDISILKGGGVVTGAYYLGVAYADDDKTETNVLTVSNPVYIVPSNDDTIPRETISGAPNNTQTSKSVLWRLTNVNTEYKYIIPYVIQYSGKARFVYKLEAVNIRNTNANIVYSGLEKVASSAIEEAVIDKVRYLSAKSITQLDNKMYAANLRSRPDLGYQRFANSIVVEPVVEEIDPFDPRRYDVYILNEGYAQLVYPDPPTGNFPVHSGGANNYPIGTFGTIPYIHLEGVDGITDSYVTNVIAPIQNGTSAGYRDPNLLFSRKSYRRGEVYAFYISFVLKDGSESFAYHIPGRRILDRFETDWTFFPNLGANNYAINNGEILAYDSNSLPYQYYDTSYMENIPLSSNMGYWENQNEFYPQGTDFETWTVGSNGQGVFVSDASNAQNIRHHKMPSNHNNRYSHVVRDTYFGDPDISEPDSIYITQAGARVFRDRVRILGIQLRNLKIPKFILNQVQGYKVYYAKRTQGNKTIIGQSGAHPATSYLAANIINTNRNAGIGPFFNIWSLDGHLKYGGLAVSDALWVPPPSVVDFTNFTGSGATNYIGNPVLKFHDFNLLRKKHTLATATHVDVQYIVLMENWRGGYKGTLSSQIPDATGLNIINRYYRAFRSGVGDDTYSWVHPDLGNMINFDASNENDLYWDLAGPRLLWGNVYVASRYSTPGASSDSTGNLIDIGTLWVDNMNQFRYLGGINGVPNLCTNQRAILSNTQTIFMLEPDGATYINGLSVLKSTSANSFKSSTYINNSFGESGIVLGLASGLPMLGGYRSNQWSYVGLGNLMWSLPIYGASGNLALIGGIDPDFYPAYNVNNGANEFVYDMALWYEMMSRGHSSLKQPYPIPTPAGDNATPIASLTATVTAGDPIVIITGIASGSGDMLDLFEGMIVTSSGGVFPNEAVVTLLQINPTSATTGSIILSEPPLVSGVRTLSFRPIGGVAGSIVNDQRTRPNVYLINLCSSKTDVFEPFDQQQLVWTGYYKSLLNVDLETGADSEDGNIYYGEGDTAQSGDIYGGDTYICKYSYRTTSNLYGLGRFVRGVNRYLPYYNLPSIYDDYLFGDVPIDNLEGITPSFGTNIFGVIADYNVLWMGGASPQPNGGGDMNSGPRRGAITISNNWSKNGGTAFSTIYQFIVESDDNINYRHAGDPEAGVSELNSMYFDKYTAADVLWRSPLGDLTKMDNILYEDHYSAQQDIRVTIPFPKEGNTTTSFPNRVIRSSTQDGNFNDTYRYFLGLQYKDFAVNKGQITNIFNLKALLYIHTEKSLFRTKGKQNLELSDATQAYIGSGDLFAQEPDEFIQSVEGYNGLYNKMGTLVTKDGYIFVARKSRKIFLVKDEIVDLTQLGMNSWARENIPFSLEAYGWDPDYTGVITDAPTADFGFLISYDPLFKRTIITKRELSPTQFFIDQFRQGLINYSLDKGVFEDVLTGDTLPIERGAYFEKSGWTISFSNSLSIWASRHSYIPPLYAYNSQNLYSFDKVLIPFQGMFSYMYEHSDLTSPGTFYERTYNFEIDCIFTSPLNALYSSFKYTANVFSKLNYSLPVQQEFNPGFTSFYVYNTTQMSGEVRLVYLNNIRKTDSNWNVNAFRDLSAVEVNSSLSVGQVDVQGNIYNTSTTIISSEPMFTSEGIINPNYINSNKPWYEQRKFVDKFLGIRLISNNLSRNLINLYTVSVASRISPR